MMEGMHVKPAASALHRVSAAGRRLGELVRVATGA